MIKHHVQFFRQFRERFGTTGAIAPSSGFLASAIVGPMKAHSGPLRVLEVGPGTGAVTKKVVELLKPDDRFDLVEINDSFAEILQNRFEQEHRFQQVAHQSQIHVCPLQEFDPEERYDYILSGLPLNNFPPELVSELFEVFFDLLKPNGVLSYFEYMYIRSIKKRIGQAADRNRLKKLDEVIHPYLEAHRFRKSWVFVNLPPAWVQHLQMKDDGSLNTD